MEKKKQEPRYNKFAKVINAIQETALQHSNSYELTYQQALSIYLRSTQLIREGSNRSHGLSGKRKVEQINRCYKQRSDQQSQ